MKIGVLSNVFNDFTNHEVEDDLMEVSTMIISSLKELGHDVEFFDVNEQTFEAIRKSNIDIAFNVCERFNGKSVYEPHVAAVLDLLNVPYTGSGPWALSLCMNKVRVKEILLQNGIPTPKYQVFHSRNKKLDSSLKFPLIVKPALMDNSIGIMDDSVVHDESALRTKVSYILRSYGQPALVEEYIEGRDLDVGVLGNSSDAIVLPIAEITYTNASSPTNIFSYEAKWDVDSESYKRSSYVCPAQNIPKYLESRIKKIASDVYKLLEVRDYGRVDIRLSNDGIPYVLEMNPNPGISAVCSTPLAAKALGISYTEMINKILQCALQRYNLTSSEPVFERELVERARHLPPVDPQ